MMRRMTGWMAIGLLILGSALMAQESVAVIVKMKGTVTVTPANSQRSNDARKGTVLRDGDRLETGAASFCAIKFLDDKSLLRLKENASCVIEGKRDGDAIDKNIFVEVGAFFASLFQPRGEFKVTTPTSVASVKGTQYWIIQLGRSGPTRFVIDEGLVEVANKIAKVLGKQGQTIIVTSSTTAPEVRLTRAGDIPVDEELGGSGQELEFEFENDAGQTKTLRINLENED